MDNFVFFLVVCFLGLDDTAYVRAVNAQIMRSGGLRPVSFAPRTSRSASALGTGGTRLPR